MLPTLKRILRAGLPAAALLAVVGYGLAEMAGAVLSAQAPPRPVEVIDGAGPGDAPADPLPADLRRTLPLTLAVWGLALVAGYELLRRLVKGPAGPAKRPPVPPAAEVDKLLNDLLQKVEADRADGPHPAPGQPLG